MGFLGCFPGTRALRYRRHFRMCFAESRRSCRLVRVRWVLVLCAVRRRVVVSEKRNVPEFRPDLAGMRGRMECGMRAGRGVLKGRMGRRGVLRMQDKA